MSIGRIQKLLIVICGYLLLFASSAFAQKIIGDYATQSLAASGQINCLGGKVGGFSLKTVGVQGSGGAVDLTSNPQILHAAHTAGDKCTIIGLSDTNTLKLDTGTGLLMTDSCTLGNGDQAQFTYDGTVWVGGCTAAAYGGIWGTITGTLSSQTDLQNALDAKRPTGDIDPDELAGDSSNNDLIDDGIMAATIHRDSEDKDPDLLTGDSTDDDKVDSGILADTLTGKIISGGALKPDRESVSNAATINCTTSATYNISKKLLNITSTTSNCDLTIAETDSVAAAVPEGEEFVACNTDASDTVTVLYISGQVEIPSGENFAIPPGICYKFQYSNAAWQILQSPVFGDFISRDPVTELLAVADLPSAFGASFPISADPVTGDCDFAGQILYRTDAGHQGQTYNCYAVSTLPIQPHSWGSQILELNNGTESVTFQGDATLVLKGSKEVSESVSGGNTTATWGLPWRCEMELRSPLDGDDFEWCEDSRQRTITKFGCETYSTCTTAPTLKFCDGEDIADNTCTKNFLSTTETDVLTCAAAEAYDSTLHSTPTIAADTGMSTLITNAASCTKIRIYVEGYYH